MDYLVIGYREAVQSKLDSETKSNQMLSLTNISRE